MPSAFETVATAVKTIFETEFAVEKFVMVPDNIHEALGRDRVAVGIAPIEDSVVSNNRVVQETWVQVKFFDLWTDEITPDTAVNPFKITGYAERFRAALRRANATKLGTGQVWFYDVDRTQYPDDPVGNKSRFVMTIRAFGNNSGLIETFA